MWTSTTKCPSAMSISNPSPMTNWPTNKLNTWRRFIKRSADESIYRNSKTWATDDTPTTSLRRRSHPSRWTATTTSASPLYPCHRPSHPSTWAESSPRRSLAFRDNLLGELGQNSNETQFDVWFPQRTLLQEGRHHLHSSADRQELVWRRSQRDVRSATRSICRCELWSL